MNKLIQSWRWYGPQDSVTLQDIKQAGAKDVVTALHHRAHGDIWPIEEIQARKKILEEEGLNWCVVESVPVHEAIKTNSTEAAHYIDNYKQTLRNLAACGIKTVCYNFMPVLDWTRTQLDLELENGAKALSFNWIDLAIFDRYILQREEAVNSFPENILSLAEARYHTMDATALEDLQRVVLMGIPNEKDISLADLAHSITVYKKIGEDGLRKNLVLFLQAIADVCTENGILMTIHPDDPPYPILGLPRIMRCYVDYEFLMQAINSPFNGFCFCTGSLGAAIENNLLNIFELIKSRIYFAHLRNIKKDALGNFYEADHLNGDVAMYEIMAALVEENQVRKVAIPFRPDHGHQLLDDLHKTTNPGYSAIGRLRGLAELRGLELGILGSKYAN